MNDADFQKTRMEFIAQWGTLVGDSGATFDDLEYSYHSAFDPSQLPELGGVAMVRIAGTDEDVLREAVVADVVAQVVRSGAEAPEPRETTNGEKDVVVLSLPPEIPFETATIYAHGDVAWVFLLSEEHVGPALEQLP